jgi:hypothetical protein
MAGVAAAVVVGVYVAIAVQHLDRPGLQYDETLFVNAALGGHFSQFVLRRLFGRPLMLMGYIGALKAYIYYPIFRIFGVSVITIRLPVVLVGGLALTVAYRLARLIMDRWLALLLLLVLATEPALIFTTRTDWGPVALMTLFKVAALFLLFAFLGRRQLRYVALLFAMLLLGLFDKLNFLWLVVALAGATPICFWPELRAAVRARPRAILGLGVAFAVLAGAMLLAFLPGSGNGVPASAVSPLDRIHATVDLYRATFDGGGLYLYMTSTALQSGSPTPWVVVIATAAGAIVAGVRLSWRSLPGGWWRIRAGLFFLLLFVVMFVEIVATPQAGGPHHVAVLWGLPELAFFSFLAEALSWPLPAWREVGLRAVTGLAAGTLTMGLVGAQVAVDGQFVYAFGRPGPFSSIWSPAIYPLSRFLECNLSAPDPANGVVLTDWGIGNQLFALAQAQHRTLYLDYWPSFKALESQTADERRAFALWLFGGRRSLVVIHTPEDESFRGTGEMVPVLGNLAGLVLRPVAAVSDDSGQPVFDVYAVSSQADPAGLPVPPANCLKLPGVHAPAGVGLD